MNTIIVSLVPSTLLIVGLALAREAPVGDIFARNGRLGRCVNLGNALEAPRGRDWGVRLEDRYFGLIADAGFDAVRIPIRWSAYAETNAPYRIEPEFFSRVDWAVGQALTNGLAAIVNMHHYDEIAVSPSEHKERFLALWEQIAEHYRDQPDLVYFEPLNEPCKNLTAPLWNEYAASAIRRIRKTNPTRAVIVGPVQWNSVEKLDTLVLPPQDRNIIVTYHYYQPFHFTHQGAGWVGDQSRAWLGTEWRGTDKEKQAVADGFDRALRWAKANNRPLFMGEFGAYEKADMASRVRWTAFVRSEAEKRSFSWAYWEFCAGFGVYDRKSGAWRQELLGALMPVRRPR